MIRLSPSVADGDGRFWETWLVLSRLMTVACEICSRGDTIP